MPEYQINNTFSDTLKNHSEYEINKWAGLYKEYMEFGGFPEVAITKDYDTKKLILKNIFASF